MEKRPKRQVQQKPDLSVSSNSVVKEKCPSIWKTIQRSRVTILVAPTGSGKSTDLPQLLLAETQQSDAAAKILCAQPRRIGATTLASYVSKRTKTGLGDLVGYEIGGCKVRSDRTRLVYVVTGIALLQCLDSCYFFDYIIIDEVHTRDSLIDLLLAVVSTQLKRYKVILMSAAMDKNHMKEYFERQLPSKDVTLMDLEAQVMRPHPIQEVFLSGESEENGMNEMNGSVSHTLPQVPQHLNKTTWEEVFQPGRSGSGIHWPDLAALIVALDTKSFGFSAFLVFLPGRNELHQLRLCLERQHLWVNVLHANMAMEVQSSILKPGPSNRRQRRIILTTDVAESSVTIPDVDLVIDCCTHKRPRWNPNSKQSFLTTLTISQDEAKQRAGRTGRCRAGKVLRLVRREEYENFQQHVEPGIKHARLEEIILTIFEHWKSMGTPEEFLRKLPDAPRDDQVHMAHQRLLELRAVVKDPHQGMPKLTAFGRLLQRMPVDPEVAILVMNGVYYGVVEECCIMASIMQRGLPFLENPNWTLKDSLRFVKVRDACLQDLPQHQYLGCAAYPSDLIAGLQAYTAWQEARKRYKHDHQREWVLHEDWAWCLEHCLSLQRLHEIEETVLHLRSVLHQLKRLAPDVPAETLNYVRERRKQMLAQELSPPEKVDKEDADLDIQELLGLCTEPKTQLLLRWCIAASFSTGALEVTGGASQGEVVEVRFIPKDGVTEDEMRRYLQDVLGHFGVDDHFKDIRTGKKGDYFAQFRQGSSARRLVQAMDFAQDVPWKHAMLWRQGKNHRPKWAARQCYMKDSMDFRLVPTSGASPLLLDCCTVITANILPVMNPDQRAVFSCSLCSVMPPGLVPVVLQATYPACKLSGPRQEWLELVCAGHEEKMESACKLQQLGASQKAGMISDKANLIRKSIDKENACDLHSDVENLVKERAANAICIMEELLQLAKSNRENLPAVFEGLALLDQTDLGMFKL